MSKYINLHNYATDEGAKKPSIASNTVKVFIVTIAVLLIGMVNSRTSTAAPFSLSFKNNLNFVCDPENNVEKRSNLSQVCTNIIGDGPNVGSVFSSIPTGSSPQGAGMLSIEQRLQSSRESEEERLEGRKDGQTYAFNSSERFAQSDGLQLPPAGGATPNVAVLGVLQFHPPGDLLGRPSHGKAVLDAGAQVAGTLDLRASPACAPRPAGRRCQADRRRCIGFARPLGESSNGDAQGTARSHRR